MTPIMANQRKKGIERVTLTLPDEMLEAIERKAASRGTDRLALMREVLSDYLTTQSPKAKSAAKRK